ncbi:hypothetical protein BRAS3843_1010015 [Bradyrhizobium sp. STM 3843]|nr:hypothetical protein BRAS3843_1010015 [Bradyrhizobium sp. STM 3843]
MYRGFFDLSNKAIAQLRAQAVLAGSALRRDS